MKMEVESFARYGGNGIPKERMGIRDEMFVSGRGECMCMKA